jgi:hypothetical protein
MPEELLNSRRWLEEATLHSEPSWFLVYGVPVLGLLVGAAALFFAVRAGRRQRLIADLPTCKSSGVFIGLVELQGTAETEVPLVSNLAATPCVYFRWTVDEHWSRIVTESYRDSQGRSQTRTRTETGWSTVAQGGSQVDFFLQDDCGEIRIRPERATIEGQTVFQEHCGPGDPLYYGKGPFDAVMNSTFRRRFVEVAIPLHAPIYVVGQAQERDDVVAPEIAHDPTVEMFLISTRTQDQVRRGHAWRFWLLGLFSLILGLLGFIMRDVGMHRSVGESMPSLLLIGAGLAAVWFGSWAVMTYNSLVTLRQRVRQAWSNVDVQLQRRHDLIPNLVKTVEGMRDYEQKVQTELAKLRSQLRATPPGQAGPDPEAMVPVFQMIRERYPELKADTVFQGLFQNLVDTEQRLALARGYFNEVASFYNARLQVIPDRFLATIRLLQPQPLLAADAFERAPVSVSFNDREQAS